MAMREDCKHYQSRSYGSGEAARFCVLDLAPEAPWRCPADCPRYERRVGDVGFVRGILAKGADVPPPPEGVDVSSVLDQAEDIVNAVVPDAIADERARRAKEQGVAGPGVGDKLRRMFRRDR